MAQWLTQGQLRYRGDIARGIENALQVFIGILPEKNLGKQLVQIAEVDRAHRTRRDAACVFVCAVGEDEKGEIQGLLFEGSRS